MLINYEPERKSTLFRKKLCYARGLTIAVRNNCTPHCFKSCFTSIYNTHVNCAVNTNREESLNSIHKNVKFRGNYELKRQFTLFRTKLCCARLTLVVHNEMHNSLLPLKTSVNCTSIYVYIFSEVRNWLYKHIWWTTKVSQAKRIFLLKE